MSDMYITKKQYKWIKGAVIIIGILLFICGFFTGALFQAFFLCK